MSQDSITFADLGLKDEVQQAIIDSGYVTPSPIQAQAIPELLAGKDVLGVAQTGTGKTAAFALPLLSNIKSKPKANKPQILCLAPTRELAIQVAEAFKIYAKNIPGFKVTSIYGGADFRGQIRDLERGVNVVVGTPGRVMDHMRKNRLQLDNLDALVLDEADEMLRMGFIDDVEWILEHTNEGLQTVLFSATMPSQIKKITAKYLKNPTEITIKSTNQTASSIRQHYLAVRNHEKQRVLARVLEVEDFDAAIIFARTKTNTLEVAEFLKTCGYKVEALNGDVAQNHREKIVARLKNGSIDIVTATDVAARGLDVKRITHVINYDIPGDIETYVHRIGRTGRAGREGDAILFIGGKNRRLLNDVERVTKQKIKEFKFPSTKVLNQRKMDKLFDKINNELSKDLKEYVEVIEKYSETNNTTPIMLAAALASLESGSKPFYIKEMQYKSVKLSTETNSRKDRSNSKGKAHRKNNGAGSDDNMDTYHLSVGETHGVKKGDIVGAIANEVGIKSKHMGIIEVFGDHSTIDLPKGMPDDVLDELKKVWIRGKKINATRQGKKSSRKPKGEYRKSKSKGSRSDAGSKDNYRNSKGSKNSKSRSDQGSNESRGNNVDKKKPKKTKKEKKAKMAKILKKAAAIKKPKKDS